MWNGLRTLEALEGGVFSRKGFLLVGTEDAPCPYDARAPDRDVYKGKQFGTQAPKPLFDSTCKPLFEGEQYVDRMPYHELQPEKPAKGFLTSDFNKRGEFSMTLRAEQHRQQIKHEARVQKLAEQKLAARRPDATAAGPAQRAKRAPLLFDLVFEGQADLCIKAKRDTRNPTALSTERHMGSFRTTSSIASAAVVASKPPVPASAAPAGGAEAAKAPKQAGVVGPS